VQARAESSLLELCRAQPILKEFKFRASEYRVKFAWTMLSAAEILYQKIRLSLLLT